MDNYVASLGSYISYLQSSNTLISDNIANAQTAGYKAKESSFEQNLQQAGSLRETNPKHMAGESAGSANVRITEKAGSVNEDGNNVNVTDEMIGLTKNNQMYAIAINALNYDTAIGIAARGK
ncbi:Flagellar basal body rod protein FlgB [Listeria grayi]|uniref:Flagellar basal body rod protein FlgB n=3 Tax=Listeria grayi TaxID=1641 RepID=D7V0G0_LISGR|nr:flagellar basal body rod protein FlgB [Listeria grayi]EFI83053.1 putative flagellar basal-body rod protein FlgB [Listeria grayi DSM 20601]EUJ29046.1 flagellar basal body rod protein FlgB [Listeria grayi FSL F6-1183]MBC1921246.1 flagellar basal body rod protein FlgB [Listeria grayi]STY43942.1 Flagellar basal body rod protein FlgB [Listeria grayi]VEI35445.1 Flagellar basal body rod protein FlgB [Listeria grayi]